MHFAVISEIMANRRQIVAADLRRVCGVEGMKSNFTYTCPNHSGVGVIDYLIFLNMVEPYHNRKMVTVNETAFKSVKKH